MQQPLPPVAPFSTASLPNRYRVVPLLFPVLKSSQWRDNYNDHRGTHRHTGIDISAPKMTPIIAPFSGILGYKLHSFWIVGSNGIRCLGTHLNDDTPGTNDGTDQWDFMFAPNLVPGGRVEAGQLIGYVGNSGDATGPHLHFELYGPDGIFNPTPSLKAARRLASPRAVLAAPEQFPRAGEVRIEGCFRSWDERTQILTLQMFARQSPEGKIVVVSSPSRVKVRASGLVPPSRNQRILSAYGHIEKGILVASSLKVRASF